MAAGVLAVVVVIVVVAVIALWKSPKPLPTVTADQMDSLLLNVEEVNMVMGATTMQGGQPGTQPGNPTFTLSDQNCLGALYAGEGPTYEDSDYDKLHYLTLSEPGDNNDHFVDEDVVLFKSADKARAFVESQAAQWKSCATQTITVTHRDNSTSIWHIGNLDGAPPKIAQMDSQRNTKNWRCQRALSVVSNVVFDVNACGYTLGDEASQIADKMAAKVTK